MMQLLKAEQVEGKKERRIPVHLSLPFLYSNISTLLVVPAFELEIGDFDQN